jgi:hypothetical protein
MMDMMAEFPRQSDENELVAGEFAARIMTLDEME